MKPASDSIPKFSLLLVEDDDSARELLTNILSKKFPDVAIYTAVNGRSGLELFKKHLPEIIVTDINMPEMDGVLMTHKIRAIKTDTKFIAISGGRGNSIPQDSAEKGFEFDFKIMKPIDFQELFSAIDVCRGSMKLRRRAEKQLKTKAPEASFPREDSESLRLLHELQVHQIELEMQNEELLQAKEATETALERYTELYDFAPMGYFTLDQSGAISAVNLNGAKYLGIERSRLIGRPFGQFVVDEARPTYTTFLGSACSEHGKELCEVVLSCKNNRHLFAQIEAMGYAWGNGYLVAVMDITERKRTEEALINREKQLSIIFDNISGTIFTLAIEPAGNLRFSSINRAFTELTGLAENQVVGRLLQEVIPQYSQDLPMSNYHEAIRTKKTTRWEESSIFPTGRRHGIVAATPICNDDGICSNLIVIVHDITEHKQLEIYKEMGHEALNILNKSGDMQELLQQLLVAFKTIGDFDAVGIRLQNGDDFPYYVQEGFSKDFLQTENPLIMRSTPDGLCRDKDGNSSLECTCGLVISGKTDPANPLFTKWGSFYTNDSSTLLDILPDEDKRLNPRNLCIDHGYASVALVPIRGKDGIVGLIQFNDQLKGRFSPDSVETLEGIASYIGAALMRKQAEEELRESEERYSAIFNNHKISMLLVEPETGRILKANPAACSFYGYNSDQFAGLSVFDINIHPQQEIINKMGEALNVEHALFQFQHRLANSEIRDVEVYCSPVEITKRQFIVSMIHDISERIRLEKRLKKSERQLAEAQSIAHIGSWEWDLITGERSDSDEFNRIFGLHLSSFDSLIERVHPDDRETVKKAVEITIANQAPYNAHYRIIRPDGITRVIHSQGRAVTDETGKTVRLVGTVLDITEQRRAEDKLAQKRLEIEELNRTLEARIVHTVNELRQKERLLVLQSRLAAMGEMIDCIAHQWRQPLNTLGLIIQLEQMAYDMGDYSKESVDKNAEMAMEIIQHMSRTIDDFRNFFRPDKNKVSFKINNVIRRTLSLVEKSFQEQRINIELQPEGDPVANGYPNEYTQVLMNILTNARDVMVERKINNPRILIKFFVEGPKTVVTVTDNAGGVPEEILGKLFDSSFTTKGPDNGTGIGLYMAKMIIEQNMGGKLTASNVGEGAEFRIVV